MKKTMLRFISFCLLTAALLGTAAFATTDESKYISKTVVSIGCIGNGVIEADCTVTATGIYPDVGIYWIKFYQEGNSEPVATHYFTDSGYSYLMGSNTSSHSAAVTFPGTIGKNYYAKVCFYAGTYGVAGGSHTMNSVLTTATKNKYP